MITAAVAIASIVIGYQIGARRTAARAWRMGWRDGVAAVMRHPVAGARHPVSGHVGGAG